MRTTVKTLGTTFAAAATVLATGTAAQAQDHDFGHHSWDGHHGDDHHWGGHGWNQHAWGGRHHDGWRNSDHRYNDHRSRSDHNHRGGPADLPDPAGTPGTGVTNAVNTQRHKAAQSSADLQQRRAALVAELNGIDAQLAAVQSALQNAEASASNPFRDAALAWVTQLRDRVQALTAQAESATTDQQLAQIARAAHAFAVR